MVDVGNLKALYRRGLAYVSWAEEVEAKAESTSLQLTNDLLERARKDLERIVYLDKDNKQASSKLSEVQIKNATIRMKLKEIVPSTSTPPAPKVNTLVEPTQDEKPAEPKPNLTK